MSNIISIDKDGHLVYEGMLSSKEKASVDEILKTLKIEIPDVENNLNKKYGKGVLYKYNLGAFLGLLLDKYNISFAERRKFWDEIKYLASSDFRMRDEGKNSATRSFYQQCYELSKLDLTTVEKLSWRQWQSLFDRVDVRSDERIFKWIKEYPNKITELEWRSFQKALHLYLKNKDTTVFPDDELFDLYNSIMMMCQNWHNMFNEFSKANPKSAKIANKSNWENKFYNNCFNLKKERHLQCVDETICKEVFNAIM